MKLVGIARRAFAAAIFLGLVAPQQAPAQEEFLIEAGKAVAIFAAKKIASAAYDAGCRNGKSINAGDEAANLICMAVSGALGKGEEEFKRDMRQGLDDIKSAISDVEVRLDELRQGQAALHDALGIIALAIDLIPSETEAHRNLVAIRGAWNDNFAPKFEPGADFSRDRNLAFAEYLIFSLGMERNLTRLNETLVRPNSGNKPALLEQHFNRIIAKVPVTAAADLEAPYLLFSSIVDMLLLEQARGEAMYAWAAAIIEAECADSGKCDLARKLPHTTDEFAALTARHRAEQLGMFNRLVERMVLDRSNPLGAKRNFLHPDARVVFASADLLTAAHDRMGFGIRGRVISAGQAFAGDVTIGGMTAQARPGPRRNTMPAQFDWWSKPQGATVWAVLHFTDTWLGYEVGLPGAGIGDHAIETGFPWDSGPVSVRRIDLNTGRPAGADAAPDGVIEFGTFLAIARAGGSYAVMNNAWDVGFADSPPDATGTATAPSASLYQSGKVVYTSKSASDTTPRTHSWDKTVTIERRRTITVADGGRITAHLRLSPSGYLHPSLAPGEQNANVPPDAAVIVATDFRRDLLGLGFAQIDLGTGLALDDKRAFAWQFKKDLLSGTQMSVDHRAVETKSFDFAPGETLSPRVFARMKFNISTSGFDATNYMLFTGIAPVELYFTRN